MTSSPHAKVHCDITATMKLPPNVTAAKVVGSWRGGPKEVWWRVKDDPEIHTFVLPEGETEEVVLQAAYAAIRLTC